MYACFIRASESLVPVAFKLTGAARLWRGGLSGLLMISGLG
jgi:hypothetical protein